MRTLSWRGYEPGIARSHVAERVAQDRARRVRVGTLLAPTVLVIALLVMPLDVSVSVRIISGGVIALSVLLGIVAGTLAPPHWAMFVNSTVKVGAAVAMAAVVPQLFPASLVYITSSVTVSAVLQPRSDALFLALGSAASFGVIAAVRGHTDWLIPTLVLVVVALATGAWAAEWRVQRAETDRRFDDLIDSTRMFFWEAEAKTGALVSITGNTLGTLGYRPDEMLKLRWEDFVAPRDLERVGSRFAQGVAPGERLDTMLSYRHRDGHTVNLRQLVRAGRNGNLIGSATDITSMHQASEVLRHQAEHDMLTDLSNRLKFQTELERLLDPGHRAVGVGLLLLDLDGFKEINDTLGHNIGDQVLQRLADRFRNSLSGAALSARIGGDEFAVLVVDESEPIDSERMLEFASGLMELVDAPIQVGDLQLAIKASAGIAIAPEHGENGDLLLQRADIALYQAKASVDSVVVYSPAPDAHSVERLQLSARISEALTSGEFELWFQPKVDLATGQVIGVEGLARWRHPDLGILTPDRFLSLLGVAGEYQAFTNQMIANGIMFLGDCQRAGHNLSVAVNLGSVSFLDTGLPGRIQAMLDVNGVDPDSLILEVTEEEILTDRDASVAVFAELEQLGLRLSIDDFGTGYSSLARLRRLRIDELKVDRSFVSGLTLDPEDRAIVRTIIELAKQLNQQTVGEGIETLEQLALLQSLGCDAGQGYLFDRPMPAENFFAKLDAGEMQYNDKLNFDFHNSWIQPSLTDIRPGVGSSAGIFLKGSATDIRACLITDRQRVDFMTAVLDMLPVGLWVKDANAKFVRGNAVLRDSLGVAADHQFLNRTDSDLHPVSEEIQRFAAEDHQVLATGETIISQYELQTRADGRVEAIRTSKYPVFNAADEVIGLIGFYTETEAREVTAATDSAAESSP